jgi:hypothetical protein
MIPDTERRSPTYTGTGAVSGYAFTFKVFADADVQVIVADDDGVESTFVLGSDYTVTLNGDQETYPGGTINLTVPLPLNYTLVVLGAVAYSQTSQLPTGGSYNATVVERALDRVVILCQQVLELASRGLRLSPTASATVSAELPAPVPLQSLTWNADGTALVNAASAAAPVSTFMQDAVIAANGADACAAIGAARAGANTDITSLDNPTIIENQSQTSVDSTIATNYWVDRRGWGNGARQSVTFSNNLDDATGAPSWGGSTGSTSLSATISGTFSCASANGGDVNNLLIGSTTWTGLSAVSTTYYLYVDVTGSELTTTTTGSTTLAPNYTEGDVYSTTNGQHTFCIPDMQMRVGDGAAANQVYRLFIGEATTSGAGVVSSFVWYGIRGRANGGTTGFSNSSQIAVDHNLGYRGDQLSADVYIVPTSTTENGYLPLTSSTPDWLNISGSRDIAVSFRDRTRVNVSTSNSINIVPKGGGAPVAITSVNWTMRIVVKRNW